MFERFTDRARTVVVMAQEEARGLGHNYIGTEHLLLGLLAEGNGVGAIVLREAGVELEPTREAVRAAVGPVVQQTDLHIPFTPLAKKVLENGLRDALQLGHNYIGTEHILLGLAREQEGLAIRILHEQAPGVEWRPRVIAHLSGGAPPVRVRRGRFRGRPKPGLVLPVVVEEPLTPAGEAILRVAQNLSGSDPLASSHFLRAVVSMPDSVAARALASLGMTRERIEQALATISTEGTSDETPDQVRARSVRIRAEDERVVIELIDPELARLLGGFGKDPSTLALGLAELLEQVRSGIETAARAGEEPGGASMDE
jgi:ATP-dependent Clp protease ATP-binding subunit ClpA